LQGQTLHLEEVTDLSAALDLLVVHVHLTNNGKQTLPADRGTICPWTKLAAVPSHGVRQHR
jgi:hypothetical protein